MCLKALCSVMERENLVEYFYGIEMTAVTIFTKSICTLWVSVVVSWHILIPFLSIKL